MKLTDLTSYADAQTHFSSDRLWQLFDGDRQNLNLAHECIDRHTTDPDRIAVRIVRADGNDEILTFCQIADASSQVAHWLATQGVDKGDRVAVMLEPSLAFYAMILVPSNTAPSPCRCSRSLGPTASASALLIAHPNSS